METPFSFSSKVPTTTDTTLFESREIIVHDTATQPKRIPFLIPFKMSDFVEWNTFKNQFSTSSDIPSIESPLSMPVCDVVPLQTAENEGIPIVNLIQKRFRSRLRKKSDSSVPIPDDEPTSEPPQSSVPSRVLYTQTRKHQ